MSKQKKVDYKDLDLKKIVTQDLHAAIGMLSFIANNPSVLEALIAETEKIRDSIAEREKSEKESKVTQ